MGTISSLESSDCADANGQFNLVIPEVDIHKADIQVYKSISTYSAQEDLVPPLLVAFILDTSDIPTSQALIWNRASGKSTLDPSKIGKGKGKAKESRSGIVLERWTFQARYVTRYGWIGIDTDDIARPST